jgi:hypothetical protein
MDPRHDVDHGGMLVEYCSILLLPFTRNFTRKRAAMQKERKSEGRLDGESTLFQEWTGSSCTYSVK